MNKPCTDSHTCANCTVDARCETCATNKAWCDDYQRWINEPQDDWADTLDTGKQLPTDAGSGLPSHLLHGLMCECESCGPAYHSPSCTCEKCEASYAASL